MRHIIGLCGVCWVLNSVTVMADEARVPLLFGPSYSNTDPLGLRLVRLCREQVLQPVAQHIRHEIQRHYSPRHLERLLAVGDVETRRAAAFGIGLIGDAECQPSIANALHDPDLDVCKRAEEASWKLWARLGTEEEQLRLRRVQDLLRAQEFHDAVSQVSLLIETSPDYAEAWNQRALTFYQLQRYRDAIPDCNRALELNPYHFGAAAGLGQCHMRLKEFPQALQAFQRTAELHPNLPGLKEQITVLAGIVKTQ